MREAKPPLSFELRKARREVTGDVLAQDGLATPTSPAQAWCGETFPPYAYSLPWFEFSAKGGAGPMMRVVGDLGMERKKQLRPLLVFPSPGMSYEPLENLEALCVSERRVAFAEMSDSVATIEELGAARA